MTDIFPAHPSRCSTDSSVGPLSVPGGRGAPGLLAAPQLLQQRQLPAPPAPPRDGRRPVDRTAERPGHADTFMFTCNRLHAQEEMDLLTPSCLEIETKKIKVMTFFPVVFYVIFSFLKGMKMVDTHMCRPASVSLYFFSLFYSRVAHFSTCCNRLPFCKMLLKKKKKKRRQNRKLTCSSETHPREGSRLILQNILNILTVVPRVICLLHTPQPCNALSVFMWNCRADAPPPLPSPPCLRVVNPAQRHCMNSKCNEWHVRDALRSLTMSQM